VSRPFSPIPLAPSPQVFRIFFFRIRYRAASSRIKEILTFFRDEYVTRPDIKSMPITTATSQLAQRRPSARAGLAVVAAAVLLSACQSATSPTHPLRGAATTVGFATTTGEPKDFVRASRARANLEYVPIGRESPTRPIAARNPAGVRDLEGELDAQRDRSEQFARRVLPVGAYNQPLPSVSRPAQPAPRPSAGQPESFPVNPNRVRQMRENARNAE
jgi:hypothetical protein